MGAGGIGGIVAATLTEVGAAVTAVSTNPEIRAAVESFQPGRPDWPGPDFYRIRDILLEIVAELERIEARADKGALSAFAMPQCCVDEPTEERPPIAP